MSDYVVDQDLTDQLLKDDGLNRRFAAKMQTIKCAGCKIKIMLTRSSVLFQNPWHAGRWHCITCSTTTCIGCGDKMDAMWPDDSKDNGKGTEKPTECHTYWHCEEAWIALLWSTLCRLDDSIYFGNKNLKLMIEKAATAGDSSSSGNQGASGRGIPIKQTVVPAGPRNEPSRFENNPSLGSPQALTTSTVIDNSSTHAIHDGSPGLQTGGDLIVEVEHKDEFDDEIDLPGIIERLAETFRSPAVIPVPEEDFEAFHFDVGSLNTEIWVAFKIFVVLLPWSGVGDVKGRYRLRAPSSMKPLTDRQIAHCLSMVRRSSLLSVAERMMKASIKHAVSSNVDTYNWMYFWIGELAKHPELRDGFLLSGWVTGEGGISHLLHDSMPRPGQPPRKRMKDELHSKPLALYLGQKTLQAEVATSAYNANPDLFEGPPDGDTVCSQMHDLSAWICLSSDLLEASMISTPRLGPVAKGKQPVPLSAVVLARTTTKVVPVNNKLILKHHIYEKDSIATDETSADRVRAMMEEIYLLIAHCPPGIFVRWAAPRLDVMKILMVGPEDTPYENGLFEFDLFCDKDFPQKAPKISFRTTNNGRIEMNPCLPASGEVHVVNLDIWPSGEWCAGKSSILSLLIALRDRIFCSKPWYSNDPWEMDHPSHTSRAYNQALHPLTVRYGMLDWLWALRDSEKHEKTEASGCYPTDFWKEVVARHFSMRQYQISAKVQKWASQYPYYTFDRDSRPITILTGSDIVDMDHALSGVKGYEAVKEKTKEEPTAYEKKWGFDSRVLENALVDRLEMLDKYCEAAWGPEPVED